MKTDTRKNGVVKPITRHTTEGISVLWFNGCYIAAIFFVLIADIATSFVFLGDFVPQDSSQASAKMLYFFFLGVSFFLTAVKALWWDWLDKRKRHGVVEWTERQKFATYVAIALFAADMYLTIGFVTQRMFPDTPTTQVIPDDVSITYCIVVFVVVVVSTFAVELLKILHQETFGDEEEITQSQGGRQAA